MKWLIFVGLMILCIMMVIMYALLVAASEQMTKKRGCGRSEKMTIPKECGCEHRYWTLVNKGDDDTDKECFCAIDGEVCYGNEVCKKKEREDGRINKTE